MKTIPRATPIALTADERRELDALVGSRKSEVRMRERARIVLLAAGGLGSRAIGRAVGCTPGTASKWRVRYARDHMDGPSETGARGAEPNLRRSRFGLCVDRLSRTTWISSS